MIFSNTLFCVYSNNYYYEIHLLYLQICFVAFIFLSLYFGFYVVEGGTLKEEGQEMSQVSDCGEHLGLLADNKDKGK